MRRDVILTRAGGCRFSFCLRSWRPWVFISKERSNTLVCVWAFKPAIHIPLGMYYKGKFFAKFPGNSEVNVSEFQEHLEEIFLVNCRSSFICLKISEKIFEKSNFYIKGNRRWPKSVKEKWLCGPCHSDSLSWKMS